MPSERAVWLVRVVRVGVRQRQPLRIELPWPFLPQAPGITFGVSEVGASVVRVTVLAALAMARGEAAWSGCAP